jgi:hypothetical protein
MADNEKPAPVGTGAGLIKANQQSAGSFAAPQKAISLAPIWADVLDYMVSQLSPATLAAISEAIERRPASIAGLLNIAAEHGARYEPVAAYFGWLHPARRDHQGAILGPARDWQNLYQRGPANLLVMLPLSDRETLAALGLCRASRADGDRRVSLMKWPLA